MIAIKNDIKCLDCFRNNDCDTRQITIKNCIPLINISDSNINILNFDQSGYIYYSSETSPTYYINKEFALYEYTGNQISYHTHLKEKLTEHLDKQIILPNSSQVIPLYYLFADSDNIFNLFICQYKIYLDLQTKPANNAIDELNIKIQTTKTEILEQELIVKESRRKNYENKSEDNKNQFDCENKKLIFLKQELEKNKENITIIKNNNDKLNALIDSLFRTFNYTYVGLSFKFNVFNVALICNKYWDICSLFLEETSDELLKDKLLEIFNGFDIINLYIINNEYKFKIAAISKNEGFKDFMDDKFKQNNKINNTNIKYNDFKKITNIENQNVQFTINQNADIINEFAYSIKHIKIIANEVKELIPDFNKIFLMAFLSKRIKEELISNAWPFDKSYIYNYILSNLQINRELSEKTNINDLKNIYYEEKPLIYEYSTVKYKSPTAYGNCMENTIFQFLKIIFWNQEKNNYDFEKIKEIVKSEFKDQMVNFFTQINEEKKPTFVYDWVVFITELPKHPINLNLELKYFFIQPDYQIEINAILENLIIALKCLIKAELFISAKEYNTPKDFIDKIAKTTNPNNYVENINSDLTNKIDTIVIYCNKKYTIQFYHNKHAKFENAKMDSNHGINILERTVRNDTNDNNFKQYLVSNYYLSLSDILSFVALTYMINDLPLLNAYLSIQNIDTIFNSYRLLFNDGSNITIDFICKKLTQPHVVKYLFKTNGLGNTFFHEILSSTSTFYIQRLFLKIMKKIKLNQRNKNGSTVWHIIPVQNPKLMKIITYYENFVGEYEEVLNIQDNNGMTVWDLVVSSNLFEDSDGWNEYGLREELETIITNYEIFNDAIWHSRKNNKNTTVELASIHGVFSIQFWEKIISYYCKKQHCDNKILANTSGEINYQLWMNLLTKKIQIHDSITFLPFNCYIWRKLVKIFNKKDWDEIMEKNSKIFKSWDIVMSNNKNTWFYMMITDDIGEKFSNKFLVNIILNKLCNKWTLVTYNKQLDLNPTKNTIWHFAMEIFNFPDVFWKNVATQKLYKDWYIKNTSGTSIWDLAFNKIKTLEFWQNTITQIITDITLPFESTKFNYPNKLWEIAFDINIFDFWKEKSASTIRDIYSRAFICIKSHSFWLRLYQEHKAILQDWKEKDSFGNTMWFDAAKHINSEDFWQNILVDIEFLNIWDFKNINDLTLLDYLVLNIKNKQFWENVFTNEHIKSSFRLRIRKTLNKTKIYNLDYKKKYLKYKSKYIQLKKQLENN